MCESTAVAEGKQAELAALLALGDERKSNQHCYRGRRQRSQPVLRTEAAAAATDQTSYLPRGVADNIDWTCKVVPGTRQRRTVPQSDGHTHVLHYDS